VHRPDDPPTAPLRHPGQQFLGVADCRRHADALDLPTDETLQATEQEPQVPAPIIPSEGMKFVDHHGAHVRKECCVVNPSGYHNCFERFRRRQQEVWQALKVAASHALWQPMTPRESSRVPRVQRHLEDYDALFIDD